MKDKLYEQMMARDLAEEVEMCVFKPCPDCDRYREIRERNGYGWLLSGAPGISPTATMALPFERGA